MNVHGYVQCSCGETVPELTAWQTGGTCLTCFGDGPAAHLRKVELSVRGTRVSLKNPKRRNHGTNKGRPETRRKAERAKLRAMRRLRMLYPDVFDVLYAEERDKVNLPPVARSRDHLLRAVETYQAPETYDAGILTSPEP